MVGSLPVARRVLVPALLAGALVSIGCSSRKPVQDSLYNRPIYDAEPYELAIQLLEHEAAIGDTLEVQFLLANVTKQTLVGCRGFSTGVSFFSGNQGSAHIRVPDKRLACRDASEFVLPPGAVLAWTDGVEVLNVGTGRAQMTTTITVVHPYWKQLREGRSTWEVRSRPVWLELHMPENAWEEQAVPSEPAGPTT